MVQKIVCSGFLVHQGRVLVIRRSEHETFLPGCYELPGGKVDFGEKPEEALIREFREEVNLDVDVGRPYNVFSCVTEGGKRHTVEIVFVVHVAGDPGQIRLSGEHTGYRWVTEAELKEIPMSPETKDSIKLGFRVTKSGS